jgi:hypothetical protein
VAKIAIGVYKAIKAVILLTGSGVTLAESSALLSGAISSCVALVGCAAIPHAVASVASSVLSIAAAVAAVGASVAAIGSTIVYVGLVLEVAIRAGISTDPKIDLTEVTANALTAWEEAKIQRNKAATLLADAEKETASTFNAQDAANKDLYDEARKIVAETNQAAKPAGITPITAMDSFVADAMIQITSLNKARADVEAAKNALKIEQTHPEPDAGRIAEKKP